MPRSQERCQGPIPRDSATSYQALAGEKNLEGFRQVSTIFMPPEVKSVAQNPSILRQTSRYMRSPANKHNKETKTVTVFKFVIYRLRHSLSVSGITFVMDLHFDFLSIGCLSSEIWQFSDFYLMISKGFLPKMGCILDQFGQKSFGNHKIKIRKLAYLRAQTSD